MRRICVVVAAAFFAATGLNAQIFAWNLENFFDPRDDPATADEPFTPGGEYHWTRRKFEAKRNLIAKTIIASGELLDGRPPAIIGLCEVENGFVLKSLLEDTPLSKFRYRTLHRDSPDPRGIDVALIYDLARVRLLSYEWITIREFATREILYAKVALGSSRSRVFASDSAASPPDTLHIYMNHWPSKYGGARASEQKRRAACEALLVHLDSLQKAEPAAAIVLMGDFNDTPDADVIIELCRAAQLQNISPKEGGTIKYKGQWEMIDQMLASPAAAGKIGSAEVFRPDFLMEEDKSFLGRKPRRTHIGPRYNGGASDHLPLLVRVFCCPLCRNTAKFF